MKKLLLALLLAISSFAASAWDGAITGTVTSIEITDSGNFDFRVNIGAYTGTVCFSGSPGWAYLNATDANYATYTKALMLAKAAGLTAQVSMWRVGNYCHIGYVIIY